MVRQARHQQLPRAGPEREALRETGRFWTPSWVAEAMVAYVLQGNTNHVFDPAVGAGAFFRAAKEMGQRLHRDLSLLGNEIDPNALAEAPLMGLYPEDLAGVRMEDFVFHPPRRSFHAIVANPPYIRHHRLAASLKAALRDYGKQVLGTPLDGRAGLHFYFFIRALELLDLGGRLAIIMPADTCEGKSAPTLWAWVAQHYRIDAAVTFAPDATPFPGVDTNAVIFLIRRAKSSQTILWTQCSQRSDQLKEWALSGFRCAPGTDLIVRRRSLREALDTGLSRPPPVVRAPREGATLGDFATAMRGIATGANAFFFLTKEQERRTGIPAVFFRTAIGRTRDVPESEISEEVLTRLDSLGRPTRLLALDGRAIDQLPLAVQYYLHYGEEMGLPRKSLISQRKPWYKMETRPVPPFLFAYLGRRNARFIRNSADVLPLTGFLCIYPRSDDPAFLEKLWAVLQHPATLALLPCVGKSYGAGAIKVEPRALERLPIPSAVLREVGLTAPMRFEQAALF